MVNFNSYKPSYSKYVQKLAELANNDHQVGYNNK